MGDAVRMREQYARQSRNVHSVPVVCSLAELDERRCADRRHSCASSHRQLRITMDCVAIMRTHDKSSEFVERRMIRRRDGFVAVMRHELDKRVVSGALGRPVVK